MTESTREGTTDEATNRTTDEPDVPRLRRLLGEPALSWLLDRVRRRMASGLPLDGTVTRTGATDAERTAVSRLLGRPLTTGRSLSVSLPALDRLLRDCGASPAGLDAAVTALTGRVTVRAEEARRLADAWETARAPLAAAVSGRPALSDWYARPATATLIRRLSRTPGEAGKVLSALAGVLPALPATSLVSLSTFAARTTGDAHALDTGPLATLTLDAIRALTGAPAGSGAQWRREVWASAGVLLDELSSQVLTLNLPGDTGTPTGRALSALTGEPTLLTLRQLVRNPPCFPGDGTVYVCENPTVTLASADLLSANSPPLVCLRGQPSMAAVTLLRLLAEAGWTVRYHGDFDWGGIRIATRLATDVPWTPWRYTATDYEQALRTHPHTTPLTGPPAPTPWDPPLSMSLTRANRRIEEELVLSDLLSDLEAAGPAR
ncbi:TIGR02679 family protein [Streptomyces xiamenensis]|uniref:TIGR02679 family protein n=1 Tax=Streptomyces xiamenensis TaxID=408015 RepID=UPI0037D52C21